MNKRTRADQLIARGDLSGARRLYRELARRHLNDGRIWETLGVLSGRLGDGAGAVEALRRACRLDPRAGAFYNLAIALRDTGQAAAAMAELGRALRADPRQGAAHAELARLYAVRSRWSDALHHYDAALRLSGQSPALLAERAGVLERLARLEEAAQGYLAALSADPSLTALYDSLAAIRCAQGQHDDALECARAAIAHGGDNPATHSNALFLMNYHPAASAADLFAAHREWGRRHNPRPERFGFPDRLDSARPLNVGYVSADFYRHSVAHFFRAIVRHRNADSFRVFCYSATKSPDDVTEELRSAADAWRDVRDRRLPDIFDLVQADKIDILVDLSGHSGGNLLPLFSRRAAPLQVTYLGYPNTTGMTSMDYRITDAVSDPPGSAEPFYSETLVRLPRGFLCYTPPGDPACELEREPPEAGAIRFVSFNNAAKLNAQVVSTWAEILKSVERSTLTLKHQFFSDPHLRQHYSNIYSSHGVDPARIRMLPPTPSFEKHLEHYLGADIALDTFPYNGTTTTCEALWMGVPVVTLAGNTHRARVGASILTQVGLRDLVTGDLDGYIRRAVELARTGPRSAEERKELRARLVASTLCNGPSFAAELESLYRAIWSQWCDEASRSRR